MNEYETRRYKSEYLRQVYIEITETQISNELGFYFFQNYSCLLTETLKSVVWHN